jgi:hypothetical protein
MKAKPTQYDSNQQSTFNLYDLFILINNNIYIYLSLQEIKQTFVRLYLSFNLFHADFFYLREIIHPPTPVTSLLLCHARFVRNVLKDS